MQEVLLSQLEFIKTCLENYTYVAEPRVNHTLAHYNPIFFKKDPRLVAIENGTFWLSHTPDVPYSQLPEAQHPRICTWVRLRVSKNASNEYAHSFDMYVANTHLNWKKVEVARDQIKVLLTHLRSKVMNHCRNPVLMMGDLNWEDHTILYQEIEKFQWMTNTMAMSRQMFPALTAVRLDTHAGKELIDYVWQDGFESILSATMMDKRPNGRLLADHRAVLAAVLDEKLAKEAPINPTTQPTTTPTTAITTPVTVPENNRCLRKGCNLTAGLNVSNLTSMIKANLRPHESYDDVMKIVTWNILHDEDPKGYDNWTLRKQDVCDYIHQLDSTVRNVWLSPHQNFQVLYTSEKSFATIKWIKRQGFINVLKISICNIATTKSKHFEIIATFLCHFDTTQAQSKHSYCLYLLRAKTSPGNLSN